MKRGKLIVFEGVDCTGKTTISRHIIETLDNLDIPVKLYRFPDRTTTIGKNIDSYLKHDKDLDDRVIHLLFSANRWEKMDVIEKLLASGTNVIVDRYKYSGIAYTAAKGIDRKWSASCDDGLIEPDLIIYLDASMHEIQQRAGFGDEVYERIAFQERVKYEYGLQKDNSWVVIDASLPLDKVIKQVENNIFKFLKMKIIKK